MKHESPSWKPARRNLRTVAVVEGFAGGKLLSRKFRSGLKASGFKITRSKRKADIIIAHSGGCYSIPVSAKAELIMFIGPPYWPGESIIKRNFRKIHSDNQATITNFGKKYFIRKKLFEFYYILRRPNILWTSLANYAKLDFLELEGKQIVVIRNQNDKFCSLEIKNIVEKDKKIKFYELPGEHDDYYTNPKPYIDLLLKEL